MSRALLTTYRRQAHRCLTSSARSFSSLQTDPSKLVHGLTKEKVEADANLQNYLKANFPEAFEEQRKEEQKTQQKDEGLKLAKDSGDVAVETKGDPERNIRTLTCYLRDPKLEEGSRVCKRMRYVDRMIPGLLYGSDPNLGLFSHQPESKTFIKTPWKFLQAELDRYRRSFESRVYELTVLESPDDDSEGTVHRVVPKNVQRHPVKEAIYCANFCRYHAGRPLKIPIVYINEEESYTLKRDGFIIPIQRFVECFVEDGAPIPERIELECTGLQFKNVIRVDRLILPDGVRFSERVLKRGNDFIVGVVSGKSRGEAIEAEGEEAEA